MHAGRHALLPIALLLSAASVPSQAWHLVSSGKQPGCVAFDPVRRRVVMFDDAYLENRTWEWDGVEWAQRFPVTSPSPRQGACMGFDPVTQRVLLFGGISTSMLRDTWAWDGANWERLSPAVSPPGRWLAAMVTDAARGRLLLFGGALLSTTAFGDLWEWDGVNWNLLAAPGPGNPPAASSPGLAYDPRRQRVVLFGGDEIASSVSGQYSSDTWEWDGARWMQMATPNAPTGRERHALAYDPVGQRVLMHGGERRVGFTFGFFEDTWAYDGTDWLQISSTGRPRHLRDHDLV